MRSRALAGWIVVFVVVLAVSSAVPVGGSSVQSRDGRITGVEFSGPAVLEYNGSAETYLWQDGNVTATVTVRTPAEGERTRSICLAPSGAAEPNGDASSAGDGGATGEVCRRTTLTSNESTVSLSSTDWPFNRTGRQRVNATVENEAALLDRRSVAVVVLEKKGDLDDDGLSNRRELEAGTNLTNADTDGDTLEDGVEVTKYETSPLRADTDDDGARDAHEIAAGTDPTVNDTDTDGLRDGYELENGYDPTDVDSDADGLADRQEERLGTDPTVADTDSDGLSDFRELRLGTDPTLPDTDDDGLNDAGELEIGTDPTAWDTDGDYLSDGDEVRFGTNPTDSLSPFGYGLVVVAVVLVGGWYVLGRSGRFSSPVSLGGSSTEATGAANRRPNGGTDGTVDSSNEGGLDRDGDSPPTMTDQERVRRLLRENGGRIQQTEVIDATDWSKSKVSRLLSKMEDDDEIRKISVGRENLIALPGESDDGS